MNIANGGLRSVAQVLQAGAVLGPWHLPWGVDEVSSHRPNTPRAGIAGRGGELILLFLSPFRSQKHSAQAL